MTFRAVILCDEPDCGAAIDPDGAMTTRGWGAYWTAEPQEGGLLQHHCPKHPVTTKDGDEVEPGGSS